MNWHTRYAQQANWTRELRSYIFEKTGLRNAQRVLEVGCGTGAILSELPAGPAVCGLDINHEALIECSLHAPDALRVQGNVINLPYPDQSVDIVYTHFLLLWVRDPLQALREMKRAARKGGYVIAFAEPDYLNRVDEPEGLSPLGKWQTASLRKQGADPGLGARLAELFFEAGIHTAETGTLQSRNTELSTKDWQIEWEVIESDLHGRVPDKDVQQMKELDKAAREKGQRFLHVPTYFAWGQV
jgi:ubiquinone/menaquinone biosynthesis C-methylase UbiE